MKQIHFEKYLSDKYQLEVIKEDRNEIVEGKLIPKDNNKKTVNIVNAIPRFAFDENYTDNFGLQWNKFKSTQLDSVSGFPFTENRFWKNTRWSKEELRGKTVLEVGSGAGRFTEILLKAGAKVVSFDYSNAVEANYQNNSHKGDLFLFQADLYDLPLEDNLFDFVFCYGVLQHTPDPIKAYRAIFSKLRPGGKISIDYYYKTWKPSPYSTPKYLWRPITSKMNPQVLLKIIEFYIPLYLPINTLIRKIPKIGPYLVALIPIPCWNYSGSGLSKKQIVEWAIMDTFDALGARYDFPKTKEEVCQMADLPENETLEVFFGSNGVVANALKRKA